MIVLSQPKLLVRVQDHQTWELVGIDGRLGGFVIEAGCLHLSPLGCRIGMSFLL